MKFQDGTRFKLLISGFRLIAIIPLVYLVSCTAYKADEPLASFQIGSTGFLLWESTAADLEKALGKPEKTTYFAKGGEDFAWNDFDVYSFKDDTIRAHVDHTSGRVFRLSVLMTRNHEFSNSVGITSSSNFGVVKDLFAKVKIQEDYSDIKFISGNKVSAIGRSPMEFSVWFSDTGDITWYDVYYSYPW